MQELQRMEPALLQQIRMLDWLGMSVHFLRSVSKDWRVVALLYIPFRAMFASRRYFITPGWIRSARGAAENVFAAVVSDAAGSLFAIAPSPLWTARMRR